MPRTSSLVVLVVLTCLLSIATFAQSSNPAQPPTSQGPQAPAAQSPRIDRPGAPGSTNVPDMVCFGYYPNWSVQFGNGGARYLGFNEPDRYFDGNFYWVPDERVWSWHYPTGLAATKGSFGLSATIQQDTCRDDVLKTTFPYSAQVYLPQGDMVSGCCRKLKAGEAPVGRHGVPEKDVAPNVPARQSAAPANNQPLPGHPVDQY